MPDSYLAGVSIAGMRRIAREILPDDAYAYYETGAGDEVTLRANEAAWSWWYLAPRVLIDSRELSLHTTILGEPVGSPVMVAPMAAQLLAHPDGESATVRASAARKQIAVISMNATQTIESLCDVPGSRIWLQLYASRDRETTLALIERAKNAGARALVLTVDSVQPTVARRRPHGDASLRPDLVFPMNDGTPLADGLDWGFVEWLTDQVTLPVVLKGVMRSDDARRAVDSGSAGIIVSNHGGRQVDGTIATAEVVGEVATAVSDQLEVYVDGGIRHGTDVLRALALGARAALVGRPALWGLAAAGEAGVARVLEILDGELYSSARECGVRDLARVPGDLVRLSAAPPGALPAAETVRGR